jgi:hypothetical protein
MNEHEEFILRVLGLAQILNFFSNILTTNNILIQCKNSPISTTDRGKIVFYQIPFCFQTPSWDSPLPIMFKNWTISLWTCVII